MNLIPVVRVRTLASGCLLLLAAQPLAARQLEPAGTGGLAVLHHNLSRLTSNARVLLIAAHPDDEDTELLTLLSRGMGVEAAYLALSRGEGGQNLIGPDLGEALGLIRTGELLAARSLDGARQFFTRGFDFGFSRSLEETERFWPRRELLADAIGVARRFRPQVIVSVFSGTPRDGHGQHQMAGVIARELFDALRDSAWGPVKLFRATRFDTAGTSVRIPTGTIDPFEGRSLYQIAMASRSLHRSQDMGMLQRIGPSSARLGLEATRVPNAGAGLFDGIDTTLAPGLRRYAELVDSARALLGPRDLRRLVPLLTQALTELRSNAPAEFRAEKEPLLEEAVLNAAGVLVDAVAADGRVVPGQVVPVVLSLWRAGGVRAQVGEIRVDAPPGWSVRAVTIRNAPDGGGPGFFRVEPIPQYHFEITVGDSAPVSEPYFLTRPRGAGLYDWTFVQEELRGSAHDPPPLTAVFMLGVEGVAVTVRREVAWRVADQALGEVRRPVFVVPNVGVAVRPGLIVWPSQPATGSMSGIVPGGGGVRTVTIELTHGGGSPTSGELRLEVPPGWPVPAPQAFTLEGEETVRAFTFEIRTPRTIAPGRYELRAVATAGGRRYDRGTLTLDYPHIRPMQYSVPATVRIEAAALALPRASRPVGYVRGASDLVPEALAAAGMPVTVLSAADLERGDLSRFGVIVIGSRAYETVPALTAANARLLDWVRAGGRLVVQYQQYQFVRGNFAAFALQIAQPHDRVTDETAPVRVLEPFHALMRTPNVIGPADWEGWVQERGLYFASEWDAAYRPLLETGDGGVDGGAALRGGLLVAQLGRGTYIYTGLAFFRQLPAGVPGAFRLFANLLSAEGGR